MDGRSCCDERRAGFAGNKFREKGEAGSTREMSMKPLKVLIAATCAAAVIAGVCACSSSGNTTSDTDDAENATDNTPAEKTVVRMGSSGIYTDMVDIIADMMPEQYDVQLVTFDSNVGGAQGCALGDIDGFIYNHEPWLMQYNKDNGTDFVVVNHLYYGRSALYSTKWSSLDELPDGASIAIANDSVNMQNNLLFLEQLGLITMNDKSEGESFLTTLDVKDNPKNLKFVEVEISYAVGSLDEVDAAICSATSVLAAGLDPNTFLAENLEKVNYPIGLTVKAEDQNDDWVNAMLEVFKTQEFKDRFNDVYKGSLVLF